MGILKTTSKHRPGKRKRPTTLTIDQDVWDRLKEIESKTDAKPSAVANRILSQGLKLSPAKEA